MKNRKIVVIAFTLIAVLLLGVGYAAVTDDLKVLGHVKTNMETISSDFQLDVRFKDGSGTIIRDDTNPTGDTTFVGRAHAKVDSVNDTSLLPLLLLLKTSLQPDRPFRLSSLS